MCFDLVRVPSLSEELESVELSSEFDSLLSVRVVLVFLLRDEFLDMLHSSLLLGDVLRLCLDWVELRGECCVVLALVSTFCLVRLFDRFESLDECRVAFAFVFVLLLL